MPGQGIYILYVFDLNNKIIVNKKFNLHSIINRIEYTSQFLCITYKKLIWVVL